MPENKSRNETVIQLGGGDNSVYGHWTGKQFTLTFSLFGHEFLIDLKTVHRTDGGEQA